MSQTTKRWSSGGIGDALVDKDRNSSKQLRRPSYGSVEEGPAKDGDFFSSPVAGAPARVGIVRKGSVEYFSSSWGSDSRKGSLSSSVFNLVSTIVGGGILSLPYAFATAGVLLGGICLAVSAVASDFSVYILVSCARRTGATTYEEVALFAFGRPARTATVFLLFAVTFLTSVAYIVLARDLLTPIFHQYVILIFQSIF